MFWGAQGLRSAGNQTNCHTDCKQGNLSGHDSG
jgi:hypothetical protein